MSDVKFGFTASQIIAEGRTTPEEVASIKTWLLTQDIPKLTDEQIILFLLSCCNNQEATKHTIKSFYSVRKTAPALFNNRRLHRPDIQKQLKALYYCVFPERTDDGCAIIYHGVQEPDCSNYEMAPALTLFFMTIEVALFDHPPKGLIILYDMRGASLIMVMSRIKLGFVSPYCRYLQECLPVRGKMVHVFNTVYFIDKLMMLLRPFITTQFKDLLHFHKPGMDMETFSKDFLPKRCLPEEFGGTMPSLKVLHERTVMKFQEMQAYFDAEEAQRLGLVNK